MVRELHIPASSMYRTGNSAGGIGVWTFAALASSFKK
jgi:hypothetical protein